MKIKSIFLLLLLIPFTLWRSSQWSYAEYDQSRKILREPRGEGNQIPEASRGDHPVGDWENSPVNMKAVIEGKPMTVKNPIHKYGKMGGKWQEPVLGEPVENTLKPAKTHPYKWSEDPALPNISREPSDISGIKGLEETHKAPGWHMGSTYVWEQRDPGMDSLSRYSTNSETPKWNAGISEWKESSAEEENRPVYNIQG